MRLKEQAGWNQTEADWRFFLAGRPEGCFVAERAGQAVGTVTTLVYGQRLAWVSMLLVDVRYRRQGIGTRLMGAALESLEGALAVRGTIALDATPAGRRVYERLGFRAEGDLVRLIRPGGRGRGVRAKTCPVCAAGDLGATAALDRGAIGAERGALLGALLARAPEAAYLLSRQGPGTGFCLGRHGSRLSQLGPVVAEGVEGARQLCRAVLSAWAERRVVIDVPAAQEGFLGWLGEQGFEVQRGFTRMSRGAPLPRRTGAAQVFAIAGPEYG
jgi:ribosomal protein S18 acetylase RimI-like enzyme